MWVVAVISVGEARVVTLLNGERTLGELADASGFGVRGRVALCRFLLRLQESRILGWQLPADTRSAPILWRLPKGPYAVPSDPIVATGFRGE